MAKTRRPLLAYFGRGKVAPARSRLMARVRGEDTAPELALRRALWLAGFRFRCHPHDLPGWPDIVNRRLRVVVFVDGCFWHGCPIHFKVPKTRSAFWREKIRRNRVKRRAVRAAYGREWKFLEVFECEIKRDLRGVSARIVAEWRAAAIRSARAGRGR